MSRIAYFEVHASNPERLVAFYHELFGWTFERQDNESNHWKVITDSGNQAGINGGLTQRRGGNPLNTQAFNSFVCVVSVDSIAAVSSQVVDLGGKIVERQRPIPGLGPVLYAQDPDGNIFGLVQAGEGQGS